MLIELFFQFFIYSIVFLVLLVIDEPQTSLTNSNTKEIFYKNQLQSESREIESQMKKS